MNEKQTRLVTDCGRRKREQLAAGITPGQDRNILSGQVKLVELEYMNRLQLAYSSYGQQIGIKDDQIRALQEQVNAWWMKYEALAKFYSHLDLLQNFKSVELKAASAQEAIDKLEGEIKTKNLEL